MEQQKDVQDQNIQNQKYQCQILENVEKYQVEDKKFINEYQVKQMIGRGSFGKVKLAERSYYNSENQIEKQEYALKIFHKFTLDQYRLARTLKKGQDPKMMTQLDILYEEINLYQYLDHQNICKLYQVIDDPDFESVFFVLDYCDLGQIAEWDVEKQKYIRNQKLVDYIIKKYNLKNQNYSENQLIEEVAKIIFYQVLQGVKYMHDNMGVVNRDIKPDNILGKSNSENSMFFNEIQISDFSTARQLEEKNEIHYDCTGTPGIRGPEMQFASDGYDPKASDLWQVGMSIFCFINEQLAWEGESNLELDIAAKNNELVMDNNKFSEDLQDLINKLCCKDWKDSISSLDSLKHKWFKLFNQQ